MPAFYSQPPPASHMPITPPDSAVGYGYRSMYAQDPYAQQQSLSQPRHDAGYEYPQSYMQPPVQPAPPSYQYPQSSYQPANSLPPIQGYYEPIGAPILPPLRMDRMSFTDDYQRRLQQEQQSAITREQQRQAAKVEEKATGGVSAKLDYDMEVMTDFVLEATMTMYALHLSPICVADVDVTRSFKHRMQNPPSFRKWVNQVLSATRLPSATILLSLHYLNDRVGHFPGSVESSENHIYRLLAVSLILGSKFLDDNTFINRSWSDVTAIKVKELNAMEREWLQMIDYQLHIDPENPSGLKAWFNAWQDYQAKDAAKQQPARLSPLDTTNVHRHTAHRDRYSPYPSPYSSASSRTYETPATSRPTQYATSAYASDPWGASSERQTFDDFYRRQNRYPTLTEIDDVNRRASEERARQSAAYAYQQPAPTNYYQAPSNWSATTWDQPWNAAHRYDCTCSACVTAYQQQYRPYQMPSSSYAQTVMG